MTVQALPDEGSAVTVAIVLTMWSLGTLLFLAVLVWARAHPEVLSRHGVRLRLPHRHARVPRPARVRPTLVTRASRYPR